MTKLHLDYLLEVANVFIHEIKTPLTTVKLYSDLLSASSDLTQAQVSGKKINKQADDLTVIINYYRDWLRLANNLLILDNHKHLIVDLVDQSTRQLKSFYPNINIRFQNTKEAHINIDQYRFNQILEILLDRLRYYSPNNDSLFIKINQTDEELVVSLSNEDSSDIKLLSSSSNFLPNPNTGVYLVYEIIRNYCGKYNFYKSEKGFIFLNFGLPLTHLLLA